MDTNRYVNSYSYKRNYLYFYKKFLIYKKLFTEENLRRMITFFDFWGNEYREIRKKQGIFSHYIHNEEQNYEKD